MTTLLNKSGKPKGYSAGKKELAKFSCRATLENGQKFKLQEVFSALTKTLKVSNIAYSGSGSQWDASFDIEYGPVKGAWASDVRAKFKRAQAKVGSTATLALRNEKREVVPT